MDEWLELGRELIERYIAVYGPYVTVIGMAVKLRTVLVGLRVGRESMPVERYQSGMQGVLATGGGTRLTVDPNRWRYQPKQMIFRWGVWFIVTAVAINLAADVPMFGPFYE
jgi:hypothetical protein